MSFKWALATIALAFSQTPATAATLYTYSGTPFTEIFDGVPDGTYDTSMRVTGFFVLAAPLPASAESIDVTTQVLTFSFSDGRNVVSNQSSIDFLRFEFSTDDAGTINIWDILLSTPLALEAPEFELASVNIPAPDAFTIDFIVDGGSIVACTQVVGQFCGGIDADVGRVRGHAGTWTIQTVVPLPPSVGLLGLGAVTIVGRCRRLDSGKLPNLVQRDRSRGG